MSCPLEARRSSGPRSQSVRSSGDQVEHLGREHEEAAVDPAFADLRLLLELGHALAVEPEAAEAGRRPDGGDGGELAVAAVKGDQLADVHVGDAVAVGQHERRAADPGPEPAEPAAGLGLEAGVHEMHPPVVAGVVVEDGRAVAEVDRDVAVEPVKVEEVLLHHLGLVAEGEDELPEPVGRVDLHDVPQHRPVADLDHRLRPDAGLLLQPRAHAAREDDDSHLMSVRCQVLGAPREPGHLQT